MENCAHLKQAAYTSKHGDFSFFDRTCDCGRLSYMLKVCYFFVFQLSSDLFKAYNNFLRIEAFTAVKTDIFPDLQDGSIDIST